MKCFPILTAVGDRVVWACPKDAGNSIKNPLSRDACWKASCRGRKPIYQHDIDALFPTTEKELICAHSECENTLIRERLKMRAKYCSLKCKRAENNAQRKKKAGIKPRKKHYRCCRLRCPNKVPENRFKFCSKECERLDNAWRKREKRREAKGQS